MPSSIEDVARKANVSISTVSRVLNRRNLVNRETRRRVDQAIEELDYRPNVFARGLMLRRSNILGFVLPDMHGEFYSELMRGAQAKARELGYHLLVSSVHADEDGRDVLAAVTTQGIVDGICVMVTERDAKIGSQLASMRRPLVVMGGELLDAPHDTVAIDNTRGAAAVARLLLNAHPSRRLIFLGGHATNYDTIERLTVLRRITAEHERPLQDGDVAYLDYTYQAAKDFARGRIADWIASPTMVFAANDEMAAGVVDAAHDERVDVANDLPVAGFDDTRIAQLIKPGLTTARVPQAEIGSTAVDLLVKRLREPERAYCTVTLATELVVRDSCGSRDSTSSRPEKNTRLSV